jgi:hypothetical protein
MIARTVGSLLLAASLTLGLAACGERTQVTIYKQGKYQGKPDSQPWDNDLYKGDRGAWEKAVRARNDAQNEYLRVSGR